MSTFVKNLTWFWPQIKIDILFFTSFTSLQSWDKRHIWKTCIGAELLYRYKYSPNEFQLLARTDQSRLTKNIHNNTSTHWSSRWPPHRYLYPYHLYPGVVNEPRLASNWCTDIWRTRSSCRLCNDVTRWRSIIGSWPAKKWIEFYLSADRYIQPL